MLKLAQKRFFLLRAHQPAFAAAAFVKVWTATTTAIAPSATADEVEAQRSKPKWQPSLVKQQCALNWSESPSDLRGPLLRCRKHSLCRPLPVRDGRPRSWQGCSGSRPLHAMSWKSGTGTIATSLGSGQ